MLKKKIAKLTVGLAILTLADANVQAACTTVLVTKGASADGSIMVATSDDGFSGDPNVVFVPAKNHTKGSKRPVYPSSAYDEFSEYNCYSSPNLVAPERGEGRTFPNEPLTKPLGYIPQVEHTYAYLDGDYAIMNEHGLMLGECTDKSAHLSELPYKNGVGIFYSSELGRVALERCKTAQAAIKLMGALIDEYGLYGTAETLLVADSNEGWIFEMQPVPSGKGGLWIAEKIPDGHFAIAANQLRIRAIRENDPNQIFNPRLPQMLKELGWAAYDSQGNLDWVKSLQAEEFNHPYYSMRRVWRGLSIVSPSLNLSPNVSNWDSDYYPLSVRPDKKLSVNDVIKLYRDYYQGTEFDKSKSTFAGLYGSPYHYHTEKNTERSILSAKTTYAYVAQVNEKFPAPVCWVATNNALDNPFVPFTVAKMPAAYTNAITKTYDASKMFWVSNQIAALNQGFFSVFEPIISENIEQMEKNSLKLVESSLNLSKTKFAAVLNDNAVKIFNERKKLYERLIVKFDNGAGIDYSEKNLPVSYAPTKY